MAKVKGNSFEAREKKAKKRSSIVKMSELREENIKAIGQAKQDLVVEKPVINEVTAKSTLSTVKEDSSKIKDIIDQMPVKDMAIPETPVSETKVKDTIVTEATKPQIQDISKVTIEEPVAKVQDNKQTASDIDLIETSVKTPNTTKLASEITIEEIDTLLVNKSDEHLNNKNNTDDFFNLNVKNDVFEGKITTVRVYDDMLDLLKKYANMKNYQIIEFTNKVITMGLDDINSYELLQISEIKMKNNTSRSIMYNLTDTMEDKLNKYIKMMNKKGYKISRNVILNVILNETLKKFHM